MIWNCSGADFGEDCIMFGVDRQKEHLIIYCPYMHQ